MNDMTRVLTPALALILAALPAMGQDLPPGLQSARLLPGWIDAEGNRISALELRLEPGWKTYWRSPGDSGLPPSFDWEGSDNLADVTFHWPAPEAIWSGDELTLGYHDLLVLPFTVRPIDPARPVTLDTAVDFGLCEKICVPAHIALQAPAPEDAPSPLIEQALAQVPSRLSVSPACQMRDIDDGVQLSVQLPGQEAEVAAMELVDRPEVWVSAASLEPAGNEIRATADFVPPSGAPFDLDTTQVRITLIGPNGAVEMLGCDPQG